MLDVLNLRFNEFTALPLLGVILRFRLFTMMLCIEIK